MSSFPTSEVFFTLLPMVLAAGAVAVGMEYLKIKVERKIKEKRGETTGERIERLSKALKESIALTNEIESEIQQRHSMATKLQADVERFEKLATLKGAEVEAVAQTLRGELRAESSKSLIKSALISLLFFVAGVVVTLYVA